VWSRRKWKLGMTFHSRDDSCATKLWRLTDGLSIRCERQDLNLHTMLPDGVATVRQTLGRGF
jgi:hypothetical protein